MSEKIENTEDNPFGPFSLIKDDTEFIDSSGLSVEATSKEVVEDTKEEDIVEPTKEVKTPSKKIKEEPVAEEVTEEIESIEEEVEETPEVEEGSFKPFLAHMANKGILDYEESEEIEDSEEGLEKVVIKTVENGIKSYKDSFPEDAQKFLEFVENGGRPADFHKYYYGDSSFEEFDITNEDNQKYVIKEALKLEGYSDEDIEDEIRDAEDLGKLDRKASVHLKKLQKIEKEQKEVLIEAQKKYAEEQRIKSEQEWENFKNGLYNSESIAGFKINKKEKDSIWEYMTKAVDKKTGVTAYQKDMDEKGAQARYLLAWLMKSNFDVTKLEKLVQTKEVSKLRSKLGNYTDSRAKMKTGTSNIKESTDNPFVGFRKVVED